MTYILFSSKTIFNVLEIRSFSNLYTFSKILFYKKLEYDYHKNQEYGSMVKYKHFSQSVSYTLN